MSLDLTPQRQTSHEISAQATASLARATIEAKFAMAHHRRRSVLEARASILDACKRQAFADGAWYKIPNRGEGFTIRFAEQALNAWRNVDVQAVTGWENESQRLIRVTVTDLESNLSFADEVLINKTVERSTLKPDQVPISVRENTDGKKVYLLAATEDEMSVKVNAAKSKVIRNAGLRLIPQDILEEAEEAIRQTKSKGGCDVMGDVKKVTDAFHGSVSVLRIWSHTLAIRWRSAILRSFPACGRFTLRSATGTHGGPIMFKKRPLRNRRRRRHRLQGKPTTSLQPRHPRFHPSTEQ